MKKILFLMLAIGLVFTSCQKQETVVDNTSKETFIWEGETFEIADTRTKLGLILNVDEKQFVFVPEREAFQWIRPNSQNVNLLYLKDIMPSIKAIK